MRMFVAFGIVAAVAMAAFATREFSQKPKPAAPSVMMCDMHCGKMMMGDNPGGPNMIDMMKKMGMPPEMMARMSAGTGGYK